MKFKAKKPQERAALCRSPQGERGLKYLEPLAWELVVASLPARGARIEIFTGCVNITLSWVAPRKGSAD